MYWIRLPLVQFLDNETKTNQMVFLTNLLACFFNTNAKTTTKAKNLVHRSAEVLDTLLPLIHVDLSL